jgi:hypothetical protein
LTLSCGALKTVAASEDPLVSCSTGIATINPYLLEFNAHATLATPWFVAANAGLETDQPTTAVSGAINTALVVSARRTIGATVEVSCNGVRETMTHTLVPTSDVNSVFNMGARNGGGVFLAGRIYSAFVFNKLLTNGELSGLEAHISSKF